jgi:metallopeptidase MepB
MPSRAVSLFDMHVHNPPSLEALLSLDAATLFQDLEEEMSHFREPDGVGTGNSHVQFNHLLHGYSAGYYSYLWGSVYAADVFDMAFAQNPRDKAMWERYRRIILEPGGSSDELKMVENFLGRPVNPEALLRRLSGGA